MCFQQMQSSTKCNNAGNMFYICGPATANVLSPEHVMICAVQRRCNNIHSPPTQPQPYFNYGHALCNAHRNTVVWGNQHLLQPQSRGEASASHAPHWNLHQENLVIGYFTSGHAHRITAKFGKISTVCSLTKSLHSTSTARYVEK